MSVSRRAILAAVATLAVLAALPAQAGQHVLVLDPSASKVSFTLDATGHEVEGTMALKSGRIAFDPATGAASGEIVLDLKSAQTGSDGRDKDMHQKVLETGKYPAAVFRAEKVHGTVAPSGPSQVTLDGTLSFHGADHKMSLKAKVEARNASSAARSPARPPGATPGSAGRTCRTWQGRGRRSIGCATCSPKRARSSPPSPPRRETRVGRRWGASRRSWRARRATWRIDCGSGRRLEVDRRARHSPLPGLARRLGRGWRTW